MSSDKELLASCLEEIAARRHRAEGQAEENVRQLTETYPEFAALESEMRSTGGNILSIFREGGDVQSRLAVLQKENLAVQKRRQDFVVAIGKTPAFLTPQYTCPICNDTGFVGSQKCECLQKLISAASCKKLSRSSPLSLCSFGTFELCYYEGEDETHMGNVLRFIRHYADTFSLKSKNLLFYGGTGLGKTHLSLAVASVVVEKGYDVVYGPAQTLLNRVTDSRFSHDSSDTTEESMLNCDLLILDDLGAEFVNQMSQSVLYNILNTRLLTGRPMIVSTNIPLGGLDGVYHERISSRLCFEFEPIPFVGQDIRQKRKRM